MPSKSRAQARLMAACSHGAGYESCPPAKVAREFNQADKGSGILGGNKRDTRKQFHSTYMKEAK